MISPRYTEKIISPNNEESLVEGDRGKVEDRGEHSLGEEEEITDESSLPDVELVCLTLH